LKINDFVVEISSRLDTFLSEKTGKSRSYIQEQIKQSRVKLNNHLCLKSSHRIKAGDRVFFEPIENAPITHLTPTPGNLNILYEDEYLLAINKSAGVIVHPGAGRKEGTLVHHLLHYLSNSSYKKISSERPGIVHRLDQGTTGVLLVAKTEEVQNQLSLQFKNRNIKKTYQALTFGKMALSGTFDTPIGRDPKDRKKMSSKGAHTFTALTQWKSLERFCHFTHVELYPHTGRTHQLRVHLSENQFPIVGDPTYGKRKVKTSLLPETITRKLSELDHTLLHAASLAFVHPKLNTQLFIEAPLPQDFKEFLLLLKEHDPCLQ